jgi:hypothetical protein
MILLSKLFKTLIYQGISLFLIVHHKMESKSLTVKVTLFRNGSQQRSTPKWRSKLTAGSTIITTTAQVSSSQKTTQRRKLNHHTGLTSKTKQSQISSPKTNPTLSRAKSQRSIGLITMNLPRSRWTMATLATTTTASMKSSLKRSALKKARPQNISGRPTKAGENLLIIIK